MASTVFIDFSPSTPIVAAWLNDVNSVVYGIPGTFPVITPQRTVTSIANLRILPKTGTPTALATGYYASGDGGGGNYYLDLADTTSADNGGTIIVAADGGRWKLIVTTYVTAKQFGARGDGVTDDTAILNAAIAYCISAQRVLWIPKGNYLCSGRLFGTVTGQQRFSMFGESIDQVTFTFPTNQGMLFTSDSQFFQSFHFRDFNVLAGLSTGGGNAGIKLTCSAPTIVNNANTEACEFTNLTFYGTDGPGNFNYWFVGIEIEFISNMNFLNIMTTGTNTHQGTGVFVHGDAARPPNVYNFTGCTFNYHQVGFQYGNYVQGVTMQQCNFTGCEFGITTIPGLSILVQLAVNCSQFNCFQSGISTATEIPDLTVNGSLFFVPGPTVGTAIGINLIRAARGCITGNSFTGYNTTTNSDGIVIGALGRVAMVGNSFDALNTGVVLQAASTNNNVQSNVYQGVGSPVADAGTGNTVGGGSM